ncbi:hypothetical protein [Henriciella sp.]|uniref:hypothetical protein n=1 Tax=Henriciella sp. TaxID=1968823 RepID=UPI002623A20C|nr:hypothetical protein [Henriciella sp.]
MNFLSIHHVFAGMTAAALGGGALALTAQSTPDPVRLGHTFTAADKAVFSNEFETAEGVCEIGYAPRNVCFEASHLETNIVKGEPFPSNMYPLALEWRARLALTRKSDGLKTVRIGQTLALIDRETNMVVDTMRLGRQQTAETSGSTAS